MKIILREEVKNFGQMGEVINVKDGYARNFLIPKGLAVEANPKNISALEHERKKIQELAKKAKTTAEDLSTRLSSKVITIKAKAGEEEKLFGSVTAADIAEALKKEGMDIDRKKILLEDPIKRLGNYAVNVKIHSDVSTQVSIQVVQE
ncbi:MAG: 50S ribosomal protein L9 [Thermodesulfovibrio sp.]|nr:50S ribosomal protein L9 [Thermodesulfovibrio sp.]